MPIPTTFPAFRIHNDDAGYRAGLEQVAALENPRQRGKALVGERTGYWRYRIGDYRVIAKIEDGRMVILVVAIGHRREIYRRA